VSALVVCKHALPACMSPVGRFQRSQRRESGLSGADDGEDRNEPDGEFRRGNRTATMTATMPRKKHDTCTCHIIT
jgi:hypothetical protein